MPNSQTRKKLFFCVLVYALLLVHPVHAQPATWYFPMSPYAERISLKQFGTLVDEAFYKGKEALFPFNRFSGYHAGVDLEVLASDPELVPVYAVASGKISYIGSLSGYGGVILLTLAGEDRTALYGHVKISGLRFKTGDVVHAGEVLTYLGDAFSAETSKERKHLHFGIYKGGDRYFRGHEASLTAFASKWVDPTEYLSNQGAIDVAQAREPTPTPSPEVKPSGILYTIIEWFRSLFERFSK